MGHYTKYWYSIYRFLDIIGKINFTKYGKKEVFNINALLFKCGLNLIA